jgi:phospholipase/lecithinase/hemolysin
MNSQKSTSRLALVLASAWCVYLLAGPAPLWGQVPNHDALFVFGDSISDTGNFLILSGALGADPAIPPSESPHRTYFRGRFSNGPIVFEHLWNRLNPQGGPVVPSLALRRLPPRTAVSFAFGASGTDASCSPIPGLLCQVGLFAQALNGSQPPKRALYAVFSGANDVLNAPNPFDPAVVAGIVMHVSQAVEQLYLLGARHVIVVNMVNLGLAPLVTTPELRAALDQLAQQHNAALASALDVLSGTLPGIKIIPVDMYSHVQSLVAQGAFDFSAPAIDPVNAWCLFDGAVPTGINCADVPTFNVDRRYFFWDVEHPTKAAHADAAAFIYQALREAYQR